MFVKVKKDLRTKYETYIRAPLDMSNGLSQVDCIKMEVRIY